MTKQAPQQSSGPDSESEARFDELSMAETKTIVTPHAFSVDTSLFGLPLASPMRRAVAMAIDSFLVMILAQQDVALLFM